MAKVGTSKKGSTISLLAAVHLECMLQAQLKRRRMSLTNLSFSEFLCRGFREHFDGQRLNLRFFP